MSIAPVTSTAPKRRLSVVRFGDINPAPRKAQLVKDMLGAGEMSCLFGPPGCGKSVLAGDLAAAIAAGQGEWMGREIGAGPVIYVAAERAELVKRRMAAWRRHNSLSLEQAAEVPLFVVSGVVDFRNNALDANEVIGLARDIHDAEGSWPMLIVVDTLSRALAGGDENSPKDMGAIVAAIQRIQIETCAHVMIVHHMPQDGSQRMRGHGALLGAVDTTILVEKGSSTRTATVEKQNDGAEGECIAFALESIELFRDGDDVTTAPVLIAAIGGAPTAKRKGPKLSKAAQIAKRALSEALDANGTVPPASSHIPPGVRAVRMDVWRDYAYRLGICASDEARARRAAFQRASEALIAAAAIGVWEPMVWLSD